MSNTKDFVPSDERVKGLLDVNIVKFLMHVLRFNKIDKLYKSINYKSGIGLINDLIEKLEVKYAIYQDELINIPMEGPFIAISNHPFGGIDGLLLLKIMLAKRQDFKILQNRVLKKITPLDDLFVEFNTKKNNLNNEVKNADTHLQNGYSLGIFPAGEVSSFHHGFRIEDRKWDYELLKFIKKQKVPIIPIYFQGNNSMVFQLLGLIHNNLQSAKLSSELFNKKRRIIKVRIGKQVTVNEQNQFKKIERFGRYLRTYIYAMGTSLEVKKFFQPMLINKKVEKVLNPIDSKSIISEINQLKKDYSLLSSRNYEVYCAPTFSLPNIHKEIGRLRELTFRSIGEGTNRELDIDEYDLYYHQLFIWDTEAERIVGAYRIGKGKEIIQKYGIKGFYIHTLFKIGKPMFAKLNESIELGRSFIVEEYQRKMFPLFLLWKGIFYFILKNPEYRYLIGPVSISNEFTSISKSLIIKFIMKYHFNYKLAQHIKPRHKYKVKPKGIDIDIILEVAKNDISKIDTYIETIEPSNDKLPVLLKRYISQNAKIIGFNVDPKFNNSLDGLIILDLFNVPAKTIESLSKELDDKEIANRFMNNP